MGKPGHAVCKQGASQRRCKADMSDIGARKAPHEARESERGARPKQMVAKTGAPVAGADEERQQGREREKVRGKTELTPRAERHALDGRIPLGGEPDDIIERCSECVMPNHVCEQAGGR